MSENIFVKSTGGEIIKGLFDIEDRTVPGYYTSDNVDLYGHLIDPQGMMAALDEYRRWGTIREMHELPVGTVESIGVPQWNFIRARVARSTRGNEVLQLIKEGVYGAFSVGILVTKAELVPVHDVPLEKFESIPENIRQLIWEMGHIYHIREMFLAEVSIVDRPANPDARMLNAVKTFTGVNALTSFPAVYERNRHDVESVFPSTRSRLLVDAIVKEVLGELEKQGGDRMSKNRKNVDANVSVREDTFTENAPADNVADKVVSDTSHQNEVNPTVDSPAEKAEQTEQTTPSVCVPETSVLKEVTWAESKEVETDRQHTDAVENASKSVEVDLVDLNKNVSDLLDFIGQTQQNIVEKLTKIYDVLSGLEKMLREPLMSEHSAKDSDEETKTFEQSTSVEEIAKQAALYAVEQMVEKYGLNVQRKVSVAKVEEDHENTPINIRSMTTQQLAKFLAEAVALNIS